MMKFVYRALVLLVLGTGISFAAPPVGSINGHLRLASDDSPLPYQYVYLVRCVTDTDRLCTRFYAMSVQTDATGYYTFDLNSAGLPEATYQLHVNGGTFTADGIRVSDLNSTTFRLADSVNLVTDLKMSPNDIQVIATNPCAGQRVVPNGICELKYTIKNVTQRCVEVDAYLIVEWNAGSAVNTPRQQIGTAGSPVPQKITLVPGESRNLKFQVKPGAIPAGSYFYATLYTSPRGRPYDANGIDFGWLIDVVNP